MKRTALFLAPLLIAFLAFQLWHTPLRGPLSEAEIEGFITNQPQTGGAAWTDTQAFIDFLREDDGRPFVMINLIEVREVANYPEGYRVDARSGQDAERAYGQAVLPQLLWRGSYPVARAERSQTLIDTVGGEVGEFETLALVRYRSRRDLLSMISSEPFLAAEVHKWASIENTLVAPSRKMMSFQLVGYVPHLLILLMGIVLGRWIFRLR